MEGGATQLLEESIVHVPACIRKCRLDNLHKVTSYLYLQFQNTLLKIGCIHHTSVWIYSQFWVDHIPVIALKSSRQFILNQDNHPYVTKKEWLLGLSLIFFIDIPFHYIIATCVFSSSCFFFELVCTIF